MTFIHKILRFGCLLCIGLWFASGLSVAQQPVDPTPSTPDLEAQPNTLQYPQGPRRHRRMAPRTFNPDSQPNQPSDDNQNPTPVQSAPAMNNIQYPPPNQSVSTMPASNPAPTAAAANPAPQPQTQGVMGPPAPVPPTPEQMPPSPPKINYQNGILTVEATNSRLIDVLNGIRHHTGIQFEGLQGAQDRVAGKFGPAAPDEVLTTLLQGSHFDYVILGAADNPETVQRVILTPAAGTGTPGAQPNQPVAATQSASAEEDDSGDETSEETPQQQVPIQQTAQPVQPQAVNGPKTPEQLLEELKRMPQNQPNQNNTTNAPLKPTARRPNPPQ